MDLRDQPSDNDRFAANTAISKFSLYERLKLELRTEGEIGEADILLSLRNFPREIFAFA